MQSTNKLKQRAVILNCDHGAEYWQGRFEDGCFRSTERNKARAETSQDQPQLKNKEPWFLSRQATGCVHGANEIYSQPVWVIKCKAGYKGNLV